MTTSIAVRRIAAADYGRHAAAFADLSRRAVAANPHQAPAAVAAATLLLPPDRIVILTAWQSEALGSDRLLGLWVFARRRDWRSGFTAALVSPLLPLYEVSSVPVIDRDHLDDVVQAFLRHINASADLPKTLLLPLLPQEGPVFEAVIEACRAAGSRATTYESWSRPMLIPAPGDDTKAYLSRSLAGGYKKRMQQFRALGRAGELVFRRERGMAARERFASFLALEASGWKGKAGTAIACRPADAAYFHYLVEGFAAEDGLQVDTLLLDGEPIAMGLLIDGAGTRHFLKIAYDETRSRFSPGRALTIAMLRADFAGTPAAVFDSGGGDGVDAKTYVWGERRVMGSTIVTIGTAGRGAAHLAAQARRFLRRLRGGIRS